VLMAPTGKSIRWESKPPMLLYYGAGGKGHNDILWCDKEAGPIVVRNGNNVCPLCGQRLVDDENKHSVILYMEKI
jgi:hypothetical protein